MKPEACLTVLGSGTLLPSASRASAGFHLAVAGMGATPFGSVLLDCGPGTLHGLAAHGIEWREIDLLAVTHYHSDHVGDLVPLLAAYRYAGRERPLRLVGPPDLADFLARLANAYGEWVRAPGFDLEVVAPDVARADVGDVPVRVATCPTKHTRGSIAVRLTAPWGSLGYTGDTGPSAELADFLSGCAVLIAECAIDDPPDVGGHLSPSLLAELARTSGPELLLVTHVYPPRTPEEAVAAIRSRYGGVVLPAFDGMRIRIEAGTPDVDRSHGAG